MDKWIRLYADMVRDGRKKLEEIPSKYREQVKNLIEKEMQKIN